MEYLYETHMHTAQGSACGRSTGAEMVAAYHAYGYSGMFVTDHFFNGNTAVSRRLSWNERVEVFVRGFFDAKAAGDKLGFSVFLGWEYNLGGAELLTYGLGVDFLLAHPDADKMRAKEYIALVHDSGGFLSQAHPFRERDYIDGIHLYPTADAVETANAAHNDNNFNRRAHEYAVDRGKIMTAGSDLHHKSDIDGTGIIFPHKPQSDREFIQALQDRRHSLMFRGQQVS